MSKQRLYATFFIDRFFYGIPIEQVREVLLSQPLAQVPLAPPAVAGLINLRGRLMTVIDLRRLLLQGEAIADAMNIVVYGDDGSEVSLLVDRVGDVLTLAVTGIEDVPATLQGAARDFLQGVYPLDEQLLLLVDISTLLADERCLQALPTP